METVTFNDQRNGYTEMKITLTDGVEITKEGNCYDDEEGGYWAEIDYLYVAREQCVYKTVRSSSTDCDGRIDRTIKYVCPVSDLDKKKAGKVAIADFEEVSYRQRDHFAEQMGY